MYERTAQSLATGIRDEVELEEGFATNRRNTREKNHRLSLYLTGDNGGMCRTLMRKERLRQIFKTKPCQTVLKQHSRLSSEVLGSPGIHKNSSETVGNIRHIVQGTMKRVDDRIQVAASRMENHLLHTKWVVFNCGNYGCSVEKCTRPRDSARIANNLSRWRELRKVEHQAKINLSVVSSVCFCSTEAQEVLAAVTYLNEQE